MKTWDEERWSKHANNHWHAANRLVMGADEKAKKAGALTEILSDISDRLRGEGFAHIVRSIEKEINRYFNEAAECWVHAEREQESFKKARMTCKEERARRRGI